MSSPSLKLIFALVLSLVVHSLLFLPGEPDPTYLTERSIIHARLDIQDRELLQQAQTGQISQQHNEDISQASTPSENAPKQPKEQSATQASQQNQAPPVISSHAPTKEKTVKKNHDISEQKTQETDIIELVEKQAVAESKPQIQQESQVTRDSRAQVEALSGHEDPTYRSYHKVLTQYLGQRLEASPDLKGTVRLKIQIEYSAIATNVTIIESSGDLDVDSWAKRAALAANPYPKVPKEIGTAFEFSPTLHIGKTTQ